MARAPLKVKPVGEHVAGENWDGYSKGLYGYSRAEGFHNKKTKYFIYCSITESFVYVFEVFLTV